MQEEPHDTQGNFIRQESQCRQRISTNGPYTPDPKRYHLYVSLACPWSQRTVIMRSLKQLPIGMTVVDPLLRDKGWAFHPNNPDPNYNAKFLSEFYLKAKPDYKGRITVPVLWDTKTNTIVNNESQEIMNMFDLFFPGPTFYPKELQQTIDATIDAIYEPINNGVYKAGFARTQEAHEKAIQELFAALDTYEALLSTQPYLCGSQFTEADICLFVTLLRFDIVYHTHFKCNKKRIRDYPALWNYTKEIYQHPLITPTCDLAQIKYHYFKSQTMINPYGIIPLGPDINFNEPHNRSGKTNTK